MTPEQLARLLSQENKGGLSSPLDVLDERELEVFSILGQGYSGQQIHSEFGIDPPELKKLKQAIQKKLGLKNEVELLRAAVKQRRME